MRFSWDFHSHNGGIKSGPLYFEMPSDHLPCRVETGPFSAEVLRRGLYQPCFVEEHSASDIVKPFFFSYVVRRGKSMEIDAYLDDFKTSIFLGSQRRSVEPIPSHRGPSILS